MLDKELITGFSVFDLSLIFDALSFSANKHKTQRRKDKIGTPYINHPIGVARNIAFLVGLPPEIRIIAILVAILHDVIEDTNTTYEELVARFGKEVADGVLGVTNKKDLEKNESKKYEIERAKTLTLVEALVRVSDKMNNVGDIDKDKPASWTHERRVAYCHFAKDLVNNIQYNDLTYVLQLKYNFFQKYFEALDRLGQ